MKGERRAPIAAQVNGCGIANPVRLTEVSGVRLSEPADVDCSIAVALDTWVRTVLQPGFDNRVRQLDVAGAYVCRGRNRVAGAKISEHGRGRAIDIRSLVMTDGSRVSVARDWNRGDAGRRMVEAYTRGCGIFGTTLGPGSDGYHEDHMHFDVPLTRRSPYCR
nr:extensin family protein [Falsirhodobacter halotolerans]